MARILPAIIKLGFVAMGSIAISTSVYASGYHLGLQSVTAVSTGNAAAAEAADPTTIVFNPAGLTYLEGTQLNGNLFLIKPDIKYHNARGTFTDGSNVQGPQNGNISNTVQAVPQVYFSHQINDKWAAGLGVYIPYAAKTNDSSDSVMRYNVNKTNVKAIDINPVIAYKLTSAIVWVLD